MKQSEAVRVLSEMESAYRTELTDETTLIWAEEMEPFAVTDAGEAVKALRKSSRFMPSLAELLAESRYHRDLRLEREGHALPGPEIDVEWDDYLAHHPDGRGRA